MMKLGIIRGYTPECFDYVKERGLEFIEICCNFDNESENFINSVDAIKAEIARTGIKVQSVGRWNAQPNKGGKIDETVYTLIEKNMEAAKEVGAYCFVCGVNYDKDVSFEQNVACAKEYLKRLCDRGDEIGIRVGVYNCDWENFVCTSDVWWQILNDIPSLGIKYDCSHSYNRGADYLAEIDQWGWRFVHFHLKGSININGRHVDDPPAGMDALNWPAIFALLYARRYDAGLSIEPHSGVWQGDLGDKGIRFTIDFAKKFIL